MSSSTSSSSDDAATWEKLLTAAVERSDLPSIISILSRDDVTNLGRAVWAVWASPLHQAVFCDSPVPIMEHLVGTAGVNVDCMSRFPGTTALFTAVSSRKKAVIQVLLDLGANMNLKMSGNGWTTLEWAKEHKMDEIVKILEDHAAQRAYKDAVKLLISKVGAKRKLEEALAKGAEINNAFIVEDDEKRLRDVAKEVKDLEKRLKDLKEEKARLVASIAHRSHPDYLTPSQMKRMRLDLEEIGEVSRAVENVAAAAEGGGEGKKVSAGPADGKYCPICGQGPQVVTECVKCNKLFCGKCFEERVHCRDCWAMKKEGCDL